MPVSGRAHAPQHPGYQFHLAESLAVAAQRPLVLAAALEIAERGGGQPPPGQAAQVIDAEQRASARSP